MAEAGENSEQLTASETGQFKEGGRKLEGQQNTDESHACEFVDSGQA